MTTDVVGIDTGARSTAAAEHILHEWAAVLGLTGRADALACTHFIRDDEPHVALSIATASPDLGRLQEAGFGFSTSALRSGPAGLAAGAERARTEAIARSGGRAVAFPGATELVGEIAVRDVLLASGIEQIRVVGGPPARPDDVLVSDGYVRPVWTDGRLVLVTAARSAGVLTPFEVRDQGPCCGGH